MVLFGSFILPLIVLWMIGFKKAAGYMGAAIVAFCVLYISFLAGMIFEFMFNSGNLRGYNLPALSTNAYAEGMTELGQVFAIPYIFVWDLVKIYFHYPFTTFSFIVIGFQAWGWFIVLRSTGMFNKKV